jgi:hypothetical protein
MYWLNSRENSSIDYTLGLPSPDPENGITHALACSDNRIKIRGLGVVPKTNVINLVNFGKPVRLSLIILAGHEKTPPPEFPVMLHKPEAKA